jgi:hypothetical protein
MRRGKKAQASIFIIVGIVLLVSAILYFVLQSEEVLSETEFRPTQFSDDAEVATVQLYAQQCFDVLGAAAIRRAGQQGGHAMIDLWDIQTSYDFPTDADGFFLAPQSTNPIPYWHYLISPNDCDGDCLFYSQRIPLTGPNSVETQVNEFVETYLDDCLNEFIAFADLEITPTARPKVETLFREDTVQMRLIYPHTLSSLDKQSTISEWVSTFDVPFKRMYDFASIIAAAQIEYHYLEWHMLEVMTIHSGKDANKLPPMSDNSFNFANTLFWTTTQVERNVQQLLGLYIPSLQVRSAQNYRPITINANTPGGEVAARLYENMVLPITDEQKRFGDISVNFEYFNWPIYFNVNDNGGIIEPNSISIDYIPFFGIQDFKTYYDVSYPVRVVLRNDDAFDGSGFVFAYGLEGNIRDNAPLRSDYKRIADEFAFVPEDGDDEIDARFCVDTNRNTEEITITVKNLSNGANIPQASLIFVCGDIACPLGETNQTGEFTTRLPICGGGQIRVIGEDFLPQNFPIFTSSDYNKDITIRIQPEYELFVEVQKYLYIKSGENWVLQNSPTNLAFNEYAAISIQNINTDAATGAYVSGRAGPNEKETVRLTPGNHKVLINVLLDEQVRVPEEQREFPIILGFKETVTIDEVVLDQFVTGSAKFDESSLFWFTTNEQLSSGNTIIFKVYAFDILGIPEQNRVVEDVSQIAKIMNKTNAELALLFPEVVRR